MSVPDRASPRSDAMPTTRATNFYRADPNLESPLAAFVERRLLLAEGQALWRERQSARKPLVGGRRSRPRGSRL